MGRPDLAVSDHVVIRCPACGASEDADPAVLTGAPTIVCRNCGETWPVTRARSNRRSAARPVAAGGCALRQSRIRPRGDILVAERRPLVGYSEAIDRAWAAKIEGDILPEEPRRSSFPATLGACGAALFIALFITGREAAVAALPDLAGLYAAIGLPVNLDGLAIEAVAAKRAAGIDEDRLTLTGTIRNVSGAEQAVPDLSASLYDIAGIPAGDRGFDPPARSIPPGEAASFHVEFTSVPTSAAEIVIRFRRAAEQAPGAVEAVATLP